MKFYAGIDGGGTRTRVLCVDLMGKKQAESRFGPFNINSIGTDGFRGVLNEVTGFLKAQGECVSLCIGAAGVSNDRLQEEVKTAMEAAEITGWKLVGDHQIALCGALNGQPGIALISGTGSICCGMDTDSDFFRVGGWGHLIGDGGSGYAIGRDALMHLTNVWDGVEPVSALSKAMEEELDLHSRGDVIDFVYSNDKSKTASVSACVLKRAQMGDKLALDILRKNAGVLASQAKAVAGRLGLDAPKVALLGGLIEDENIYRYMVADEIRAALPGAGCVKPAYPAIVGAVLLAGGTPPREV